ncbi:MAG TPA: ester cyclase [Chloroflexia bacterium]|nr:ester cyclase [Chloroflexia bacterium]
MDNVEVYRRVFDAVNRGDEGALDELLTTNVIDHNPVPGQEPGVEGFKHWMRYVRATFADLGVTVDDTVAQGDRVAGRVTWRGTHAGPLVGVEASGHPVEFTAIHIVRFEDGKAAEWWGVADLLGALQQIGAQATGPPGQ